ncbi:MAG: hypothetical protein K1X29_10425 [Bdellovibrionales bacterium]|nr:hypothetical protein [Bdellovibrionales bacterium]
MIPGKNHHDDCCFMISHPQHFEISHDGNISGVSGYASTCLQLKSPEERRFFFVLELVFGGFIWLIFDGKLPSSDKIHLPIVIWCISGILVGFGSRLGGGCTSDHDVCGLGRVSI